MKRGITTAVLILCAGLAACKKKAPENVPVPKAEPPPLTAAVVSTAATAQNPLTAAGSYLKSTVGQVQKAKDARALYEKSAKDRLSSMELDNTGGN